MAKSTDTECARRFSAAWRGSTAQSSRDKIADLSLEITPPTAKHLQINSKAIAIDVIHQHVGGICVQYGEKVFQMIGFRKNVLSKHLIHIAKISKIFQMSKLILFFTKNL